jgi:CrcB protein
VTPLLFVAIACAGGIGAACRLLIDGLIKTRARVSLPISTMIINVSGSLLLGFLTGLAIGNALPEQWHLVLGGGFLGGYTTFSTASVETVRLIQGGRYAAAAINGFGVLVVSVAAAGLGLWLGGALAD